MTIRKQPTPTSLSERSAKKQRKLTCGRVVHVSVFPVARYARSEKRKLIEYVSASNMPYERTAARPYLRSAAAFSPPRCADARVHAARAEKGPVAGAGEGGGTSDPRSKGGSHMRAGTRVQRERAGAGQ